MEVVIYIIKEQHGENNFNWMTGEEKLWHCILRTVGSRLISILAKKLVLS
jgi:hypothetical protein